MRTFPVIALLLLAFAATCGADESAVRVELCRPDAKELTPQAPAKVVAWAELLVKSAVYSTTNQGETTFKQSIAQIQDRYRTMVRGHYLVVSYQQPMTFNTQGGAVTAIEIVVGLDPSVPYASGLFTIDPQGRTVMYGKFSASRPPELAPAATPNVR